MIRNTLQKHSFVLCVAIAATLLSVACDDDSTTQNNMADGSMDATLADTAIGVDTIANDTQLMDTSIGEDSSTDTGSTPDMTTPNTIYDIASGSDDFDTLTAAVDAAGLDSTLDDANASFTVFAPTDAAFDALLSDTGLSAQELLADPGLVDILTYHVIDGAVDASAVSALDSAPTLNGIKVYIDSDNGVMINDVALVVTADITADNGIIHVIDTVLLPPNIPQVAALEGAFDTLLAAATTAEIDAGGTTVADALSDAATEYTVLAPTDAAFEVLLNDLGISAAELLADPTLTEILLYHALSGAAMEATVVTLDSAETLNGIKVYIDATSGVVINDSVNVVVTDVLASNGVIHVLDAVLIPPTLAEVAAFEGFDTLVAAVGAAGLDSALTEPDADLTVFAPTEDAFNQLLSDLGVSAAELLADPSLASILLYHLIDGETPASTVVTLDGVAVPSLLMQDPNIATMDDDYFSPLMIGVDPNGGVSVNGSNVVVTDVMASNGIIHVIDSVLVPSDAVQVAMAAGLTELANVLVTLSLDGAVSAPNGPFTIFAPVNQAWTDLYADANGIATAADVPAAAVQLHLTSGFLTAADVVAAAGSGIQMADGSTLSVAVDASGNVTLGAANSALITTVNVPSSNALIHLVDTVLLP